jgi:hypothetical protein
MDAFPNVQSNQTAPHGHIQRWIEVWDYSGDAIYRGFVAEHHQERTLFVFFEDSALDGLKSGYVILFPVSPWIKSRVSPFWHPHFIDQLAEPPLV